MTAIGNRCPGGNILEAVDNQGATMINSTLIQFKEAMLLLKLYLRSKHDIQASMRYLPTCVANVTKIAYLWDKRIIRIF